MLQANKNRWGRWELLILLVALVSFGCATQRALTLRNELPFDRAVQVATDGLVAQTRALPAFMTKVEQTLGKRGVVIDPMIDAKSGQQTAFTKLLEKTLTDHLTTKYAQFEVLSFQAANLPKATYLLTGTTSNVTASRSKPAWRISLALTELKSGNVVAQASVVARDDGLDTNPTPFYRDSPVLMKDHVAEGY